MRGSLGLTVVLYALVLTACCGAVAVAGRQRSPLVTAGVGVLQLAVVGQALLDGAVILSGRRGTELATHVGYLLTSLVVLPAAAVAVRLEDGRWGSTGLALGCLVLAVVSLRLHQTLPGA